MLVRRSGAQQTVQDGVVADTADWVDAGTVDIGDKAAWRLAHNLDVTVKWVIEYEGVTRFGDGAISSRSRCS